MKLIAGIVQNTEELKLYLFELAKKIEKLATENADLKKQVEKLSLK
jgi:cell division protein FtsB